MPSPPSSAHAVQNLCECHRGNTQEMNALRYNPPDSATSAGVVRDGPPVKVGAWRRRRPPAPVFLPGQPRGQRSLAGCSPWGHKESDTTERLHFHLSLSCIGEGHGNPLQYSCLENPMDRGAWLAAVPGVTKSRTRLSG